MASRSAPTSTPAEAKAEPGRAGPKRAAPHVPRPPWGPARSPAFPFARDPETEAAPAAREAPESQAPVQLKPAAEGGDATAAAPEPPRPPNRTGLPDTLKAGVEALSGLAMDDVRVHRNSALPAKLGALAFAQGSDIHLSSGQEQHLPHEAWHVVQQKQGRVRADTQLRSKGINLDRQLEREADTMGARAVVAAAGPDVPRPIQLSAVQTGTRDAPVQRTVTVNGQVAAAEAFENVPHDARQVILGWLPEAQPPLAFADLAAVIQEAERQLAVDFLAQAHILVTRADIQNPELNPDHNCHGFTFGEGFLHIQTIRSFLQRYDDEGGGNVLLCLQNGEVAHSARLVNNRWRQAIANGPIFNCDRAQLNNYQCFDLSVAPERALAADRDYEQQQALAESMSNISELAGRVVALQDNQLRNILIGAGFNALEVDDALPGYIEAAVQALALANAAEPWTDLRLDELNNLGRELDIYGEYIP